MPVLLLAYAPGDSPPPLPLEFFAWLFLEALPVVPAVRCLAGLLSLHGFFHRSFSRKKRRKISALLGLSFSGAVVFTDAASWAQAVRLLNDCRAGLCLATATAPQKFPLSPFLPKTALKFWLKIIPQSPLKGDMGNGFWGIDGGKIRGYHPGQAQAKRPGPSEPPQGVQKGEVNMTTPTTADLLNLSK